MKLSFLETELDQQSSFGHAKHTVKKFERDLIKSDAQYRITVWITASSFMTKYSHISSSIKKPFLIHDFAPDPFWIS